MELSKLRGDATFQLVVVQLPAITELGSEKWKEKGSIFGKNKKTIQIAEFGHVPELWRNLAGQLVAVQVAGEAFNDRLIDNFMNHLSS